jgi:hypothetical protein
MATKTTAPEIINIEPTDKTFYFSGHNVSVKAETIAQAKEKLQKLIASLKDETVVTEVEETKE